MYDFFIHLGTLARGCGKTTVTCKAAKEINAAVLVRNHREAKRIKALFGIEAYPYNAELQGKQGPFLVDPDAVACYAMEKRNEIEKLYNEIATLQKQLSMYEEMEKLRDAQ